MLHVCSDHSLNKNHTYGLPSSFLDIGLSRQILRRRGLVKTGIKFVVDICKWQELLKKWKSINRINIKHPPDFEVSVPNEGFDN